MNSAKADRSMKRPGAARAFTLTELLVVITLLVIVIAVGLPAFGAMLASSNRTLAIGQFKAAMSAARDAAIRSTDSDSAAVFFFEPGGRMTIVPCVQVGTVQDRDHLNWNQYPNFTVKRDVFAPAGSSEPIQLPPGWMVRAFAGSAMLDDGNANATGWYGEVPGSREYNADNGSWVFPETGFFNQDADRDTGANNRTLRQTFMVRFEKGTGNLVVNQAFPSVVLAPRSSEQGAVTRVVGTPLETDWRRVDRTDNVAQWARRLLARRVDPSAAVGSGKVLPGDLAPALPGFAIEAIREALPVFGRKIRGFDMADAVFTGVETRTSCPLRLTRGDDFQSLNVAGLYPGGEGAGYAGGILSAGVDGIRVAEAVGRNLL